MIKFYEEESEIIPEFAVILTKMNNKWLLCKQKQKDYYEFPGGKKEKNESIQNTAKRELYEETGAINFELKQISLYSMEEDGKIKYGMLFFAEVYDVEKLPNYEMEKIFLFEKLPSNLRYPEIYKELLKMV